MSAMHSIGRSGRAIFREALDMRKEKQDFVYIVWYISRGVEV